MNRRHVFETTITRPVRLGYLLAAPKGYDAASTNRWPLLLFLHGAGERGTNLSLVSVHGPPKLVKQGRDFPFLVLSPQCPAGETWNEDALLALLDDVTARHRVDTNRVYLSGMSMGGYGSWNLAARQPERFAAVAPICGGGPMVEVLLAEKRQKAAIQSLGIWAFHGAKDSVVPLEESQRMVDAFKRIGCNDTRLTVYPDADHDSWTVTYENPQLYEWLLAHRRSAR